MPSNAKLNLLPLFLSIFVDSIGWGVVFPVFDTLIIGNVTGILPTTTSLVARNVYFELLIGVYCLGMFLASPVLGSYSDHYGRKKLLIISLLGGAVGFFICAFGVGQKSIILLFIGRIVSGLTAGNMTIAQAAIADQSNAETMPKRLGLIVLANGIGFACGPVIGGLFFDQHLWHHVSYLSPFLITGVGLLVVALALVSFFHESFAGNAEQKTSILLGFKQVYQVFTLRRVRNFFIVLSFFFISYTIFFSNIPIFLKTRFSTGGTATGYLMTYFAIIFTLGLIWLYPKVTAKFSLKAITLVSVAIQIVGYLVFSLLHNQVLVWLILIPIALTVPFIYVSQVSLISFNTDANDQGKAMGVVGSVIALTWGLGPFLAGVLVARGIGWVYVASIFLMALALLNTVLKEKSNNRNA